MPAVLQPNAAIPINLRRKHVCDEDLAGAKGHAAGTMYVAPDGAVLLLRRSDKGDMAGHWGLPGGHVEGSESPEDGAQREAMEEMGPDVPQGKRKLIDQTVTPSGMAYHTFAQPVDEKFTPKLNDEHTGYDWASPNSLPSPMHPAVQETLSNYEGMAGGLLKFLAEEAQEPEHAEDAEFSESDHPRAPDGKFGSGSGGGGSSAYHVAKTAKNHLDSEVIKASHALKAFPRGPTGMTPDDVKNSPEYRAAKKAYEDANAKSRDFNEKFLKKFAKEYREERLNRRGSKDEVKAEDEALALALDRESIKSKDVDGRLHVADVPLCRESVDEYKGSEIPGCVRLGLDPEKIYLLWRPAEELKKALPTINGIPVLRKHVATSAADHKSSHTIGAVGTNARWDPPFIRGDIVIWPEADIKGIESKDKSALSPGYRYEPVMEVGDFAGQHYDGKMTKIVFNHEAVVENGRQAEVGIDSDDELRWAAMERALLAI